MSFYELLNEAQFHGSTRLAERKNRCCWGITLALFLWMAASIISTTILRFIENPAFLEIGDTMESRLKFPLVGICPEITYPENKVDEFLAGLYYPPGLSSNKLKRVIQQLSAFYAPDVMYSTADLKMIEYILDLNLLSVKNVARRLTASCEEILLRCRLFGVAMNCSDLFTMELTNYGFCCIFNGRSLAREMKNHKADTSMLYTSETSPFTSLICVVDNTQPINDLDLTYKWVYAEHGRQFAETVGNGTPISPNTEVWLGYNSKRFVITDPSRLNPELRNCRQSSTKLKYFPNYSRRYCMLECEMARTIRRCFCARMTHPRPFNVPECRANDLLCAKNLAVTAKHCDCPVTCDSALELSLLQSYPLKSGDYVIDQFYQGLNLSKVSIVRVHLLEHKKIIRKRQSYYRAKDLFAQIGGVFNVFFGCSILTLIELMQLAWHYYSDYKVVKAVNKKSVLILPPEPREKTKNKLKNKVHVKNKK